MKKIHKIILVVTVCATLFISFVIPISATGANDSATNYLRVPYLDPKILISNVQTDGYHETYMFDSNLTFPISFSPDGVFLYNSTTFLNGVTLFPVATINRNKGDNSLYGINSNVGDFGIEIGVPDNFVGCNFTLAFNPFALPKDFALSTKQYAYNSLGTFYIHRDMPDSTSQNYLRASSYSMYSEIVFVAKDGEVKTLEFSKSITLSTFYYSKYFLEELRLFIRTYSDIIDSDVLVKSLHVKASDLNQFDQAYIFGTNRWIDSSRNDIYKLFNTWNPKVFVTSPTILESVASGVNAIWNLKIFNTFTIGNIFSACVGILMTRWLLKMFVGG